MRSYFVPSKKNSRKMTDKRKQGRLWAMAKNISTHLRYAIRKVSMLILTRLIVRLIKASFSWTEFVKFFLSVLFFLFSSFFFIHSSFNYCVIDLLVERWKFRLAYNWTCLFKIWVRRKIGLYRFRVVRFISDSWITSVIA